MRRTAHRSAFTAVRTEGGIRQGSGVWHRGRAEVVGTTSEVALIIHPGTPLDPDEPDLEKWVKRAERFN